MKKTVRLGLIAFLGLSSTLAGPVPAFAEAGCQIVQEFWFDRARLVVIGINEYVCSDPERGHPNTVTIRKYNPRTFVTEQTIKGLGYAEYRCEGDDFRYFYGPGDRLDIYCS